MKDRNFVKEIEKLRTAVLGYDREEVVLYIRELVEYYGQKNEEAVRELYLEKMQLAAENAGLRAQIPTQEKLYAEAEGKAEEILGGAKETAAAILDHAGTEKERMLKEAGEAEKRILAEADRKAGETLAEADRKAGETITEADQKAGETLTEAERKAGEILAEAGRQAEEILAEAGRQMDVILTKTREKVEKEQALYHQYRSRLESLKKGLDCIFAECPPEEDTRDPQGKPQRLGQIQRPGQTQADGPEEAGLREQP
jgi:cell division septum initiation protein DivIVA